MDAEGWEVRGRRLKSSARKKLIMSIFFSSRVKYTGLPRDTLIILIATDRLYSLNKVVIHNPLVN